MSLLNWFCIIVTAFACYKTWYYRKLYLIACAALERADFQNFESKLDSRIKDGQERLNQ